MKLFAIFAAKIFAIHRRTLYSINILLTVGGLPWRQSKLASASTDPYVTALVTGPGDKSELEASGRRLASRYGIPEQRADTQVIYLEPNARSGPSDRLLIVRERYNR